MDVSLVNNTPYSLPRTVEDLDTYPGKLIGEKIPDVPNAFPKEDSMSEKVRDEAMMNLQEVQNFLYMIIGSRLRIENNQATHGMTVNTCA